MSFRHMGLNKNNDLKSDQIISIAFELHAQGDLFEAERYYELFIKKGFIDARVLNAREVT